MSRPPKKAAVNQRDGDENQSPSDPQRSFCCRDPPGSEETRPLRGESESQRWFSRVSLLEPCVCLAHGSSKGPERKEEAGSQQAFSAKGGRDLARTPWHGHNARRDGSTQGPCRDTRRSSSGAKKKRRLSGAAEQDGRESGSEAEGKIETDFLAGVEIKDEQMI